MQICCIRGSTLEKTLLFFGNFRKIKIVLIIGIAIAVWVEKIVVNNKYPLKRYHHKDSVKMSDCKVRGVLMKKRE